MNRYWLLAGGMLASSLLIALSFPPQHYAYLAWFSLVPLLCTVRGLGFVPGFAAGLGTFVFSCIGQLVWLHGHSNDDGSGSWLLFGYILLGLVCGSVCGLIGERKVLYWGHCLWAATGAVLAEALLLTLLPVHFGLSQYKEPFAMLLSSISGIWSVSWLAWFANLIFAAVIVKRTVANVVFAVCLLVFLAITSLERHTEVVDYFRVSAIQTDSRDLEHLRELTLRAQAAGAQLIIWPELSAAEIAAGGDTKELRKLSESTVPSVTTFEDDASPLPYNMASLFQRGHESPRYAKRKPFAGERFQHAAGSRPLVVQGPLRVGLNICFDSCYPAVMRDTVREGAEMIALPTLDPPSLACSIQALHNSYTTFRAAELGVPIVRAEARGYSSIVGSNGLILAQAGTGEAIITADLTQPINTIYRRYGDWFLYLCACAVAARSILRTSSNLRAKKAVTVPS